jgi:hypothetical protein
MPTVCVQASFPGQRNKIPMNFNGFYIPSYPTFCTCGETASWSPWNRGQTVSQVLYCVVFLVFTRPGQLVCVILVAVICDKPAAHKTRGFASHSHNFFCSLCWISVHDKGTELSFQAGGASLVLLWSIRLSTLGSFSVSPSDEQ